METGCNEMIRQAIKKFLMIIKGNHKKQVIILQLNNSEQSKRLHLEKRIGREL